MRSNCFFVALFSLLLAMPSATAQEQRSAEVPSVVTPYDSEKMPTGEDLLAGQVFGAGRWTAKVNLHVRTAEQDDGTSLVGELISNHLGKPEDHVVAALFDADEHKIGVRFTGEQSVAWSEGGEADEASARIARAIYLLGLLVEVPGDQQSRAEILDQFTLKNLGIGINGKNNAYLVEATVKAGGSMPERISSLGVDRILVAVSTTDTMPRRITASSEAGVSYDIDLQSISITVRARGRGQLGPTPPDDATTIELAAAAPTVENPIAYEPQSIARGKQLYLADCVVCHSLDGTGRDSDVTDNAADLTATEYWLSDGSESATFLAIRDGAGDEMPGYKDDYRDENKIWDLVNYITSLQKTN